MEEPSQFSVVQTAQRSLTCSITEKPHTGLDDCLNMLLACFRATMSAAYGRSFLWPSPYLPVMAADRDRLLGNFPLGLVKLWKELLRKTLLDLERRLTAYYSQNCSGLLEFPSRKLISQRSFPQSMHFMQIGLLSFIWWLLFPFLFEISAFVIAFQVTQCLYEVDLFCQTARHCNSPWPLLEQRHWWWQYTQIRISLLVGY